jgi:hypothetical protein
VQCFVSRFCPETNLSLQAHTVLALGTDRFWHPGTPATTNVLAGLFVSMPVAGDFAENSSQGELGAFDLATGFGGLIVFATPRESSRYGRG